MQRIVSKKYVMQKNGRRFPQRAVSHVPTIIARESDMVQSGDLFPTDRIPDQTKAFPKNALTSSSSLVVITCCIVVDAHHLIFDDE
jgi:hypothetical protein